MSLLFFTHSLMSCTPTVRVHWFVVGQSMVLHPLQQHCSTWRISFFFPLQSVGRGAALLFFLTYPIFVRLLHTDGYILHTHSTIYYIRRLYSSIVLWKIPPRPYAQALLSFFSSPLAAAAGLSVSRWLSATSDAFSMLCSCVLFFFSLSINSCAVMRNACASSVLFQGTLLWLSRPP